MLTAKGKYGLTKPWFTCHRFPPARRDPRNPSTSREANNIPKEIFWTPFSRRFCANAGIVAHQERDQAGGYTAGARTPSEIKLGHRHSHA